MLISNFNIVRQTRGNTCGYATAAMILSFLEGQNIDEDYLLLNEPFGEIGITFTRLMEVYKKYLKIYKAEIVYGDNEKMGEIIRNSIQKNIPMHIMYLTENLMGNGKPILHYSALIGFDDKTEEYYIADPYGSTRSISKEDFFNAISFRNECLPEIVRQRYPSNMMIRFSLC